MLFFAFSVVVAALPPATSLPMPAFQTLAALEASLGSEQHKAHIDVHRSNDRRCALISFAIEADIDAARAQGHATLPARGLGKDARGRRCQQDVVVDVRWSERINTQPLGTALSVRVRSGGLELETEGVVVSCSSADRAHALVCARTSQGKTVKGVVDAGALQVQP